MPRLWWHMSVEPIRSVSEPWEKLQGHVVNGAFPLHRYLGSSDHSAVFLTESEKRQLSEVALKLVPLSPSRTELQASRWLMSSSLTHPHLLRILEAGRCQLGGVHYAYVVTEYSDQNLAQLLEHRALTEDETREMLTAVLSALAFLHERKLVQGQLKPSNILVVGDQLKVGSDTIRAVSESGRGTVTTVYDAPEFREGSCSPASDVWALGVMLSEALTQRQPAGLHEPKARVLLPPGLSDTFHEIIDRCLSQQPSDRPTIAQVEALLRGEHVPPAVSTPPEENLVALVAQETAMAAEAAAAAAAANAAEAVARVAVADAQDAAATGAGADASPAGTSADAPMASTNADVPAAVASEPAPAANVSHEAQTTVTYEVPPPEAAVAREQSQAASQASGQSTIQVSTFPSGPAVQAPTSAQVARPSPAAEPAHQAAQPGQPSTPVQPSAAAQSDSAAQPSAPARRSPRPTPSAPVPRAMPPSAGKPVPSTPAGVFAQRPVINAGPPEVAATQRPPTSRRHVVVTVVAVVIFALAWAAIRASRTSEPAILPPVAEVVGDEPVTYSAAAETDEPAAPVAQAAATAQPASAKTAASAWAAAASKPASAKPVAATLPSRSAGSATPAPSAFASGPPAPTTGIQEVLPEVPERASRTIRGTVKVAVRVIIDKDGTVFAALTDSSGPSRYFERLAIDAAKKWQFPVADTDDQRFMVVRFDFTRNGTTARALPLP